MIRYFKKAAPLIVMAIVVYYLSTRVNWTDTFNTLKTISPFYLVFSVVLNILSAVSMSTAHFVLITGDREENKLLSVESINARVLGYPTVLPSAVVAAYKIAAFQKIFKSSSKAFAFFAVGKISSLLVALLVLFYIGYTSERFVKLTHETFGSENFLILFVLLICSFIFLLNIRSIRQCIILVATKVLPTRVSESLRTTKSIIGAKAWSTGVLTQGLAFILTAGAAALIAIAINPLFPTEAVFVGRAITLIALLAPISIAGVGAREVSFLAILPFYSVNVSDTAALVLLLLLTQWLAGLISLAYALALTKLIKKDST